MCKLFRLSMLHAHAVNSGHEHSFPSPGWPNQNNHEEGVLPRLWFLSLDLQGRWNGWQISGCVLLSSLIWTQQCRHIGNISLVNCYNKSVRNTFGIFTPGFSSHHFLALCAASGGWQEPENPHTQRVSLAACSLSLFPWAAHMFFDHTELLLN